MNYLTAAKKYEEELRAFKDDLHAHPEESFAEFRTTAKIRAAMEDLGAEIIDLGMETGVTAMLRGEREGSTVMLRADIDSVKLDNGCAHLCGHDLHTACLLGAAKVLFENRRRICGNVVFLFQPAEEFTAGAKALADHGLFEKLRPRALFGLHCRPEIAVGKAAVKEGALMARKSNFRITIHGVAGHAGMPHKYKDVIVAGAAVISALQTIVSRCADPLETLVCSISSIHSGNEENFPTDSLTMSGDIRSYSDEIHEMALGRLKEISSQVAAGYGCSAQVEITPKVPALRNSHHMSEIAYKAAAAAVGEENIVCPAPSLASEDFAVLAQHTDSFFYWLGTGTEGTENCPWHNPAFTTDDRAIVIGAALLAESAAQFLEKESAVKNFTLA